MFRSRSTISNVDDDEKPTPLELQRSRDKNYPMNLLTLFYCTKRRPTLPLLIFGVILTIKLHDTFTRRLLLTPTNTKMNSCESPSLPDGSVHIVIAGYRHKESRHLQFSSSHHHNYLFHMGLTNAHLFWYRRQYPNLPPSPPLTGQCGMTLHERVLFPNHGREAAAFMDHVLEVYDDPPEAIVFLHGHGAKAWHTSCEATIARTAYFYRDLVEGRGAKDVNEGIPHVRNHMMSLTSSDKGTENAKPLEWYGYDREVIWEPEMEPCSAFLDRWKDVVKDNAPYPLTPFGTHNPYQSCCANFILPGERVRRFPKQFWHELKDYVMDEDVDDAWSGRACFEYIIYDLMGDAHEFPQEVVEKFYGDADGLVHGELRSDTMNIDPLVVSRVKKCEKMTKSKFLGLF